MWVPTYTGKRLDPFDPQRDQIDLIDIAHALSQICRYNGHTVRHYSVAEHCVRVSSCVPARVCGLTLMHDAAEAYIGDMVRPIKRRPEADWYRRLDTSVTAAILHKFGLHYQLAFSTETSLLSKVDLMFVNVEMDQAGLYPEPESKPPCQEDTIKTDADRQFCQWMFETTNQKDGNVWGWDALTAKTRFLDRCRQLGIVNF